MGASVRDAPINILNGGIFQTPGCVNVMAEQVYFLHTEIL